MKDKIEQFLNAQSDAQWPKKPLFGHRLLPNEQQGLWSAFMRFGIRALVAVSLVCLIWAWPYLPGTLGLSKWGGLTPMALAYVLWNRLESSMPILIVLVFNVTLLYLWAWNRRADRLQREGTPVAETVPEKPLEGVWPPPPTAPLPTQTKQ